MQLAHGHYMHRSCAHVHNAWCIYTDTFNHYHHHQKKHHRHHQKITTTQCKLLERKYGICASGWKEKHHQRKLQWVKPPRVQVEYLCQLLREKHHHRKLVPVTTTVRTRCKGAGGVHNAAIIVTCVRVHNSNFLGQGIEEI